MRKKILILGADGKLGKSLARELAASANITSLTRNHFDAEAPESLKKIFEREKPDFILNAVVYGELNGNEKNPEKAFRINTLFPKFLAEQANQFQATLIHFCSSAVFASQVGSKKDAFAETDCASPTSIYSITKYAASNLVASICERFYIFRLGICLDQNLSIYQFLDVMIGKLLSGEEQIDGVDDIYCNITYIPDLAAILLKMILTSQPHGLYHAINAGCPSRYELLVKIAENLNAKYVPRPIKAQAIEREGHRLNLKSDKIAELPLWTDALRRFSMSMG